MTGICCDGVARKPSAAPARSRTECAKSRQNGWSGSWLRRVRQALKNGEVGIDEIAGPGEILVL